MPTPRRRGAPSPFAALEASASAQRRRARPGAAPRGTAPGRRWPSSTWPVAVVDPGAQRVAQPELEPVEAQLSAEVVDQRLARDRGLRHAEAAERAGDGPFV